jgi:4-hydroxyphenylpyruvate dioxygenase-like putative hemolysin
VTNSMGIRKYDYVEFYVGSAKMVAYWYAKALGLDIVAYKGPETGCRDRTSYYLVKNDFKIVITSPLQPDTFEVQSFLQKHGDGVKRWAYSTLRMSKAAFTFAVEQWSRSEFKNLPNAKMPKWCCSHSFYFVFMMIQKLPISITINYKGSIPCQAFR